MLSAGRSPPSFPLSLFFLSSTPFSKKVLFYEVIQSSIGKRKELSLGPRTGKKEVRKRPYLCYQNLRCCLWYFWQRWSNPQLQPYGDLWGVIRIIIYRMI